MVEQIKKSFMWADYLIFGATLVISLGIGLYQAFTGGKQRTTGEYLMANRQLRTIPVALSIFMSFISAILVLGQSAETYVYGTQASIAGVSNAFAYVISAHFLVPVMHPLRITTVYEYNFKRYHSELLRMMCMVADMTLLTMYLGLAMYAPATALEAVTGFPLWATILCTGAAATIYTTLGGMKAVIWTDVFQGIVLFGGVVLVLIMGCIRVGGLSEVWRLCYEGGRINFFNMDPDPTTRQTFWTATFGGFVTSLSMAGSSQTTVQRYCALPTQKNAKLALLMNAPLLIAIYVLMTCCGMTAYAYYTSTGCDPLRSGLITSSNQILPYFLVDVLNYPGLPGLFVAVLFSGALSSLSSSLNSLSAATWTNFLAKRAQNIQEHQRAFITKVLVFTFGCIGVGLAFMMKYMTGHVMQVSATVLGALSGPLAGVIMLGCLFPWVQWKGAMGGLVIGLALSIWIAAGQNFYKPHREILPSTTLNCSFPANTTLAPSPSDPEGVLWVYRLSYQYVSVVGWVLTIIIGLILSFVTGRQRPADVDPRVVVNWGDRMCCCLTKDQQEICWCGTDFNRLTKEVYDDELVLEENKTNPVRHCIGETHQRRERHEKSPNRDEFSNSQLAHVSHL